MATASLLWVGGAAGAEDDPRIEQMQRQIEALQRELAALRSEVNQVKKLPPPPAPSPATGQPRVATSGNDRIKLEVSGQVNRAINVANDGRSTKAYFVDNDTSNTRVRFVGTGQITDDLTLGTLIEIAIAPNESSEVSQDNEDSGDFFDERKVEVSLDSKKYGQLSLGKGAPASDGTAEVDLSGTSIVQYSSVADVAGGLRFREKGSEELTDIQVSDAFDDFDGLSRQNLVRYDSPTFGGFGLSGSVVSDQRYDGAITWAARGYGLKAAAAVALADPNDDNVDYRVDGSFSVLHEATGLNLTMSSGMDQADDGGNPSNFYVKGGWIANLLDLGATNLGLDYTRSTNNPTPSDHGFSVGGALVQELAEFGTQLYTQLRLFDLSSDPSTDRIWVGTVGTRVKF
jgi:predicted porin